jgi:protein TonB
MAIETPPVAIQKSRPEYPEVALTAGVQGTVDIEVTVTKTGDVGEARVIHQSTPELEAAAVSSVRGWKFRPATQDAIPVESKVCVLVAFTLSPKPEPAA